MRGRSLNVRSRWRRKVTATSRRRSYRPARSHARGPSHDFTALDGADHRLGEMVEPRILGKEPVEHRAEQEDAGALQRPFVNRHRDLDAARRPDAAALANAAYNRPAVDIANAADAALGDGVGHFCEHRQGFLQRLGIASRPTFHKTEMI